MELTLTAYSDKMGKEWPVAVTIERYKMSTNHRVVSAVVDLDGKRGSGKLTERQGFHCIQFLGDEAKKIFAQREVLVKLREGKEVVEVAIQQLDEQAKAEQITEMESAGKMRYFIAAGGDTGRVSFGMCAVTDEAHRYDPLTSAEAPEGVSCAGEMVNSADYLAGRFGAVAIISCERYEEILNLSTGREQEKQGEREAAEREEQEKFEQARVTGHRVELYSYVTGPCEEEGCMDTNIVYAMPDGSRKEERYHSY